MVCNKKQQYIACFLAFIVVLLNCSGALFAETLQFSVNPIRTIFTDKKNVATIQLVNPTDRALSYALSVITMQKNSEGKWVETIEDSEKDRLIKEMIRFSPRRAVIKPMKRQLVKMMLRKTNELPVGEYQAWLHLVPKKILDDTSTPSAKSGSDQLGVSVDIIVSSNFPIIIQNGDISSKVTVESVRIQPRDDGGEGLVAELELMREGDASSFGTLEVMHFKDGASEGRQIGRFANLAMYKSVDRKKFYVPLRQVTEADLQSGYLEVVFQPLIKDGNNKEYLSAPSPVKRFSLPLP